MRLPASFIAGANAEYKEMVSIHNKESQMRLPASFIAGANAEYKQMVMLAELIIFARTATGLFFMWLIYGFLTAVYDNVVEEEFHNACDSLAEEEREH
ncbi:hypothetical protein OSTOST_11054 [Ostertagia ostertagi]